MESKNLDESNTTKLSSQDSHKILSKRKIMGLRLYEFLLQFNLIGYILDLYQTHNLFNNIIRIFSLTSVYFCIFYLYIVDAIKLYDLSYFLSLLKNPLVKNFFFDIRSCAFIFAFLFSSTVVVKLTIYPYWISKK